MFNTENWSKLTEDTYGYSTEKFVRNEHSIYYSKVKNEIGEYLVAPSFGDFLLIDKNNFETLNRFLQSIKNKPSKIKVCCSFKPQIENFETIKSGYIHQVEFDSYINWSSDIIKYKYRNKINQSISKGINVKYLKDKESLYDFYKMHASLRMSKFNEIPQPWKFFECIFNNFFKNNKGYLINAYDPNDNLVAGILLIINNDIAYYKFNASYLNSLQYRPNNFLMDRLISFCDKKGIKKLNLGFTGESREYDGLRTYKLSAGAKEYPRFILKNNSFSKLNNQFIKPINNEIVKLLSQSPTIETVNNFSEKYYKYFI